MRAALADAIDPAAVVVVHGDAGIGKTSLIAQCAGEAAEHGATVLWGACHQGGGAPYGPWVEALDRHLASLSDRRVAELVAGDTAVLAALAPTLANAVRNLPQLPELSPSDGQQRLFNAVVRLLGRLSEPLIVLDDLQWADPGALDLLVHVARIAPRVPVLVIYRGVRLALDDPLAVRLARVARLRPCSYVRLKGLAPRDAAELLEREANEELDPRLVDAVYAETHGNPFFVGELGRHIQRSGGLELGESGRWRLPETIRGAVALRLAALTEPTRRMLELAAVFTSGFAFDELEALTGIDEMTLLDCLEEALGAELLDAPSGDRYDFTHALVRQTLYEGLSPSRRARMHRQLARALEALYGGEPPARLAAEIAHQYGASAILPGAERGVAHALAAAQHARRVNAPADAVELLRSGLLLVPKHDHALRAQLLSALALAEAEAAMPAQAGATLESAIALLERSGAPARAIAELACDVATAMWGAIAYLRRVATPVARALELLGDEHDLLWARLKLFDRFAEPISSGVVRITRLVAPDPEARRIVRSSGSEADKAATIDVSGHWEKGELEWAIAEIDRWRDPAARCTALFWVVTRLAVVEPGSFELGHSLCDELEALAEQIGSLLYQTGAVRHRSALLGAQGLLDAATKELLRARELAGRLPEPDIHMPIIVALEAMIAQHRDLEWWRAGDDLWQAAQAAQRSYASPMCAALACSAFAHGGMRQSAQELLAHVVRALLAASPWDYFAAAALSAAGAAIWELQDAELAAQLLPAAEAAVAQRVADWYMSSNDLTVARLATILNRPKQARRAFERARERLEGRQLPMRAIVDVDEARAREMWHESGTAELLASAQRQFEQLRMTAWLKRQGEPPGAAPPLPGGLSPREAEVLRLLATGMTNREIAEELVLSVHTVERHVNNAYAKIGAHNRADAASYVVRNRL